MDAASKVRLGIGAAILVCGLSSWVFGSLGFALSAPVALASLLAVPSYRLPAIGALLGWCVWFRDYDFLLNPAGPETPISNAIRQSLGVPPTAEGLAVVVPLLVLIGAGCVVGFCLLLGRDLINTRR
jgi:hypothetical protein